MTNEEKDRYIQDRANWETPRPQKLPKTTYWPFAFAMGLAFLFWGILTSWIISAAGFIILIVALAGWITELRHEQRNDA